MLKPERHQDGSAVAKPGQLEEDCFMHLAEDLWHTAVMHPDLIARLASNLATRY